jgi:hypothetical protein
MTSTEIIPFELPNPQSCTYVYNNIEYTYQSSNWDLLLDPIALDCYFGVSSHASVCELPFFVKRIIAKFKKTNPVVIWEKSEVPDPSWQHVYDYFLTTYPIYDSVILWPNLSEKLIGSGDLYDVGLQIVTYATTKQL